MKQRNGWTKADLNWLAWRLEGQAAMIGAGLIFIMVTVFPMMALLTLAGVMHEGWGWLWSLISFGGGVIVSLLIGAYPDPIVRLYLRIKAGPQTTREETNP